MKGRGRINILILVVSMPGGGVETQILSIARRLDRSTYNPVICCIRDLGACGAEAHKSGIEAFALNLMKSSRFDPAIAFSISRVLKENHTHVLWTHQYAANLYGRMASIAARTPVVVSTFHALYDSPKKHRSILNHLLSYATDTLVTVSDAVASDVLKYDRVAPGRLKTIHNGTDLEHFHIPESKQECRKRLRLPEDDIIIGNIGRLSAEKNHIAAVKAVHMLPEHVKGLIIGGGPLRDFLEDEGKGRFYFTGQMDYNLIPVALKAMDIFCFPSLWEGFGSALVEAMAAGLPVVASDIPPHREVLGSAGLLISPDDIQGLASSLTRVLEDTALKERLSGESRNRAELFSIDGTAAAYERLFEEMLVKKGL